MQTLEQFKLKQYRILARETKDHINTLLAQRATANNVTLGALDALEEKYTEELKRIKARIAMLKPRKEGLPEHFVTANDVAMAKLRLIKDFLPSRIVNGKTLCLFHNDKTPSMHVYGTTYHCFTCGAHGTIVDVIMHLRSCSFTKAVKFLVNKG